MGYSLAWVAVRGVTREAALEALGMSANGKGGRIRQSLGELPGGWLLYLDENPDRGFGKPLERLVTLGAPTVACRQEDHVMRSEARGYEGGREIWRIVCDSSEDERLAVSGKPPAPFEELRAQAQAEQAAEDEDEDEYPVDFIYEVPLNLGMAIFGFRPGETEDPSLTPLKPAGGGGFFARLFGRR